MGLYGTSEKKVLAIWIIKGLPFLILSASIYYGTQSDIRVKSYCPSNLLGASIFNFEGLDILRDSVRHPNKKLLPFGFARVFFFEHRASRYITGLNRTSKKKLIFVFISSVLPFSISTVFIYYGTQSDIRVKSYCRLNLLASSVFNFERLDISQDSIGHPSKKLLPFEFPRDFRF